MTSERWPARYEIHIDGLLDERWAEWLAPMDLEHVDDQTVLSGVLPDQSALHGVLERLRDLNACIIVVRRVLSGGRGD